MKQQGTKKGLSPTVLLLLLITVTAITVVTVFYKKNTAPPTPDIETNHMQGTVNSFTSEVNDPTLPTDPPYIENDTVTLSVTSKTVSFNSGGEVLYGYPTLTVKDNPEVSEKISSRLTELVNTRILPIIEQMASEDTPNAYRSYHFSLYQGSSFYSVVVTVDISEGITFAREIYGWNFLSDTGEYVSYFNNCLDKMNFANVIDASIENVAAYDQIIHQWLIDTVTDEYETNEFSIYFENENMIAVLNKRLRLNSFDRDPIMITVPYEKIENIFPNYSIN